MRTNVYAEELIDDVQLVEKVRESDGGKFTGIRFYLEGSPRLHPRVNGHDDRSAVTFWGNTHSLRTIFLHALDKLGGISSLIPVPQADPQKYQEGGGHSFSAPTRTLTKRQKELTRMFAIGATSKEVAGIFNISVKTVDTHRANIMRRLGFHSVTDLVYYAIREGLVQAGEEVSGANPRQNTSQGKVRGTEQTSNRTA